MPSLLLPGYRPSLPASGPGDSVIPAENCFMGSETLLPALQGVVQFCSAAVKPQLQVLGEKGRASQDGGQGSPQDFLSRELSLHSQGLL